MYKNFLPATIELLDPIGLKAIRLLTKFLEIKNDLKLSSLNDIAESIPDGAKLALAPEYNGCGCALSVVRSLINRSPKNLHLIGVPALGLQADLLIGINAVSTVECAAVSLGEEGLAPRFSEAIKKGSIKNFGCYLSSNSRCFAGFGKRGAIYANARY